MAAFRTARSAVALAAATLLVAVAALFALSGTAQAQDLNCREDFTYQEDAQAVLAADPTDPNHLDSNHDGVACETLPHRFTTGTSGDETTSATTVATATATATTQPAALVTTVDDASTTSSSTTSTTTATDTTSTTSTTTTDSDDSSSGSDSDDSSSDSDSDSDSDDSSSTTSSGDDKDCADFASQADAQAALDADLSDPDNLDADTDGIACEQHFGAPGQQVEVYPTGGVDTGGEPADA
jgi:hypothetical protein